MYHIVERDTTRKTKAEPLGQPLKGYTKAEHLTYTEEEIQAIMLIQKDMRIGRDILTKPQMYYNGRSVIEEMNYNQKRFNSYIPPKSNDPDESWHANTVRPLTRNKLISIAAHVTARIIYPEVFAQNKDQAEDKLAKEVMSDTIEWAIETSEYKMKFIGAVLGALTDPVIYMEVGFAEVMRTIKDKKENGKWTTKQIVDELMSGFVQNIRQANEVYITNMFENNVQKQRAVGIRTLVDRAEAQAEYGSHKNWACVQMGTRTIYDVLTNTFYSVADPDLYGEYVEKVVYRNRYLDLELVTINGVLVTDADNPITRNDKKYGIASMGYEFLNNGNFAFYKSAVNKLAPDQDVVDTMYNMVIDGTFIGLIPPMALFGTEEVTSSIIAPGALTQFKDKETKLETIGPKSDIRAGMEAISLLEKSMSESSQDQFQAGIMQPGERTAEEIQTIQRNAERALGLFGKMLNNFVKQIGELMVGDILQYMTVTDLKEITGEANALKYKTILIKDKVVDGKKVSKKFKFTDRNIEKEQMTYEEIMSQSADLLSEEGDGETLIYEINPVAFRNIKFHIYYGSEQRGEQSEAMEKALNLEAYDRLIQSPALQNPESQTAITRDFLLEVYRPGEADKYLPKNPAPQMMGMDAGAAVAGQTSNQFRQKGVNTNLTQQITGGTSIKKLAR